METAIIQELLKHLEIRLTKHTANIGGGDYIEFVTGVELYWKGEFLLEGDEEQPDDHDELNESAQRYLDKEEESEVADLPIHDYPATGDHY